MATPDLAGHSTVALRISAATGFKSFASVVKPRRVASNGIDPPPAVGSRMVGVVTLRSATSDCSHFRSSLEGVHVKAREYPYASEPKRRPSRVALAIRTRAATGSPCMPSAWTKRSRSAVAGSNDARMAARDATSGRLAHQTCSLFGAGNGVMGVRSRTLSMPISAIGSHCSISRVVTSVPSVQLGINQ